MSRRLLALLLLWPSAASAQSVTFDEAIALSDHAPPLEAARRERDAREEGDEGIGGTVGQTSVTAMPGAVVAPDNEQGFEAQLTITQGWNLSDLGGAARSAASAEREALDAQTRAAALRARLEAARRWIELATLHRVEEIVRRRGAVLARHLESAERGRASGSTTQMEVVEARAERARVAERLLAIEGERFAASQALALAMGRTPTRELRASGALPDPTLPDLRTAQARLAALDALPDVAVRRALASAARAREAEVSARVGPVLSVGAQLERSASDAYVVYGVLGLTFQAFGQGQRASSTARADTARAEADVETARRQAASEVTTAIHEVEHARRTVRLIERTLLPALTERVAQRTRLVEAGEQLVFAQLHAERDRLTGLEARARARGAVAWAEVALWSLLGELAR